MNIGIPKERRAFEYRVGLFPAGVKLLTQQGNTCYVEHDAGLGSGFSDQEYIQSGAKIVYTPHEVFGRADLLLKVARPTLEELIGCSPNRRCLLAAFRPRLCRQDKIEKLIEKEITAISYELITLPDGTVPIRKPLSQIGGIQLPRSGRCCCNNQDGKGILIGGCPVCRRKW
jgi:alanine dehydrogenase